MLESAMDDPCFLLGFIADELGRRGMAARNLAAIAFQAEVGEIGVSTRAEPLAACYPALPEILDDIGRTCRDEGITVEQLRRITFFEDEINLETGDGRGSMNLFTWPIRPQTLHS